MNTVFYDDLYLYDLNLPESPPLAWRSANGGMPQPDLPTLLGMSLREWLERERSLYQDPICIVAGKCAVILPISSRIGRFAAVVVPQMSQSEFVRAINVGLLGDLDPMDLPMAKTGNFEAEQAIAHTVQGVRLLISQCMQAECAAELEDCIALAVGLWGVVPMPAERMEFAGLALQGSLPEPSLEPGALAVSLMTMASLLRNAAHARSGWLYAEQTGQGPVLQCIFRADAQDSLQVLEMLQAALEAGGVTVGRRDGEVPVRPPRQYSYMHSKRGDPMRPLCNKCSHYDGHCAHCIAVRWAIWPYVTDGALLGIKNYLVFEQ